MLVISIDINNTAQVIVSSNSLPVFDRELFPFFITLPSFSNLPCWIYYSGCIFILFVQSQRSIYTSSNIMNLLQIDLPSPSTDHGFCVLLLLYFVSIHLIFVVWLLYHTDNWTGMESVKARWSFPRYCMASYQMTLQHCNSFSSLELSGTVWVAGPRLNIKTVLSAYGVFHVKDKTAVRTSYL